MTKLYHIGAEDTDGASSDNETCSGNYGGGRIQDWQ